VEKQKQQTHVICKTKKGPIWDTTGGPTGLEAIVQYTNRLAIQT